MRPVAFDPKLRYELPEVEKKPDAVLLISEVAARLLELSYLRRIHWVGKWLYEMGRIYEFDHFALQLYLEVQTGDMAAMRERYSDRGFRDVKSKQAVQQRLEKALHALKTFRPDAAKIIGETINISAKIE